MRGAHAGEWVKTFAAFAGLSTGTSAAGTRPLTHKSDASTAVERRPSPAQPKAVSCKRGLGRTRRRQLPHWPPRDYLQSVTPVSLQGVGSLPATGGSICPSHAIRKHHPQAGRLTTAYRSRLTQPHRSSRRTSGAGVLPNGLRSWPAPALKSSERSSACSGRWAAVSVLRDAKPVWRRLRSSGKPPRHFGGRPASRRLWG